MYTGEMACVCWQGSQKDQQPGKNIDREMCSRSEWSCGGRRRNIHFWIFQFASNHFPAAAAALGLFSGHHTSLLGEVCCAEYENSGTSTTWPTRKECSQGVCVFGKIPNLRSRHSLGKRQSADGWVFTVTLVIII